MNPDLHMAEELKTTSKGNLFVVFGEPDIDILDEREIRSDDTKRHRLLVSSTPTTTRRASSSATPISWRQRPLSCHGEKRPTSSASADLPARHDSNCDRCRRSLRIQPSHWCRRLLSLSRLIPRP
jgi:hypothetical protein